jgi:hypothetical protein
MDETRTKVLQNGAVYDLERKRIVAMRPELAVRSTQITQANAGDLQARRVQSKRDALARGAQRVLEASGRIPASDLAFVEAIGEALMESAQDPSNRQQVRAAELLIRETGLSERTEQPAGGGMGQAADLITALAQFAAAISGADVGSDAVIDADAFDNYNYRNHSAEDTDTGSPAAVALPGTGTG